MDSSGSPSAEARVFSTFASAVPNLWPPTPSPASTRPAALVGLADGLGVWVADGVGLAEPSGVGETDSVGVEVTLGETEGETDGVAVDGGDGTPGVGAVWPQPASASAATVTTSTDRFTGRMLGSFGCGRGRRPLGLARTVAGHSDYARPIPTVGEIPGEPASTAVQPVPC